MLSALCKAVWFTLLAYLRRHILCSLGLHGKPVGACDIQMVDSDVRRTIRYNSWWKCSVCDCELKDYVPPVKDKSDENMGDA